MFYKLLLYNINNFAISFTPNALYSQVGEIVPRMWWIALTTPGLYATVGEVNFKAAIVAWRGAIGEK